MIGSLGSVRRRHALAKSGFSLVELLTVIAVVALLMELMLPAVMSAREMARRTICTNNLRQLGLGTQLHLDAIRHFPTGGWTSVWVGDPNRGYGENQPGGWCYNLLPYIERRDLHDVALALEGARRDQATAVMFATPVSMFVCPTRRPVEAWPFDRILFNSAEALQAARSDYAANIGNLTPLDHAGPGPRSYKEAENWVAGEDRLTQWVATYHNGVVHQRSVVRPSQVTDGLSRTFLYGEKYLNSSQYETGQSHGDDQSLYVGFDRDNARSTNILHPPLADDNLTAVYLVHSDSSAVVDWNFGSAHPTAMSMLMCDGAVRLISYDFDANAFVSLGSRDGGEVDDGG
jgi:prepilin-type N-terminal cleavage/methylation domain-containing protein